MNTAAAAYSTSSSRKIAPGPEGHWLVGNMPELRRDPLALFTECARDYGDIVRMRFGPKTVHLISAPDLIKDVLQDNPKAYTKETRGFLTLRNVLGMGLLTSDGDTWLRQRRIAQPAFHRQKIAAFGAVMAKAAVEMADGWARMAERGRQGERGRPGKPWSLDIASEMMRLTLRIAGETLLSTDVSRDADTVGQALSVVLADTRTRVYNVFNLPLDVPSPQNRRVKEAIHELDTIVYRMIDDRRRRKDGERPADLLSMLLDARDETTGEGMTDRQLRDEVMTIFLAGHETTANALTWTFYLLSLFPEAGRKLHAELASVLSGRAPGMEDVPRLPYTAMVFEESMRLYPPVWMISRAPRADTSIGGYFIPKGSYVLMSPYVTHRRPDLWDNPEGFDPERFAASMTATVPRFAYFPFGGGPRQCIGNTFAMMEGVIVLAALAQRFRLDLVPGQSVRPEPMITLRPKGEIRMIARPRPLAGGPQAEAAARDAAPVIEGQGRS